MGNLIEQLVIFPFQNTWRPKYISIGVQENVVLIVILYCCVFYFVEAYSSDSITTGDTHGLYLLLL